MKIDSVEFFAALATEMNAHPERFQILGDADMVAAIVMTGDTPFAARLTFEELRCDDVAAVDPAEVHLGEFSLVGPLDAWQAMFDDILANGRATGLQTINSLALLGNDICLVGDDPMGSDKFSRFNQTLQEFFDGAARVASAVGN